ncbi:MAG: right-handed parallel beta-helix repeat-containing protein [Gemmatimonadota bacterium]|nr:right-handed parallel beta-helix repeat-containing protein [Gemmatimonadota bacterium]
MRSLKASLVVAVFLFALNPQTSHALKTLSGAINTNTVLDTVGGRIYNVTGAVSVSNGVTLAIDPGVVLKFNIGAYLNVSGKLMALGGATADSLIYFTSIRDDNAPAPLGDDTNGDGNATVPAKGDWYYIYFYNAANDSSTLDNCVIRYAGRSNQGAVYCENASPTLEDCDLAAGYYGIQCIGVSNPVLRNTAINAMTDVPIAIEIASDPVFDNLVFESTSDNGFDAIGILGGTLSGPNTLRIRGATLGITPIDNLVYILLSDITIAGGGSLTIDPGVVVKPKASVDIFVNGTLTMDGTSDPDSAIVFTSFKDDNYGNPADTNNDGSITSPVRGDWGQIEFLGGSSGSVSYAVVKFGGYSNEGVIRFVAGASPSVANTLVSDTYYGIELGGQNTSAVSNNAIENTLYTPIYMSVAAQPMFSGNTVSNNGLTAIGIIGESIGVNSRLPVRTFAGYTNITYWLASTLTVNALTNLTIDPGVVVKFNFYYYPIVVNGSLTADGKVDSVIAFTSQYDDDVGNPADTEGNGAATTPAQRQWAYIYFAPTSTDGSCVLDYCRISYGGYYSGFAYSGAVWCSSASPTITNCDFRTNGTGIRTDGTAAPTITDNNFYNNKEVPLATSVVANPQYSGNTFDQNTYHVVGVLSETLAQNATLEKIYVGGPPQFTEYFPYAHLGTLTIGSGSVLTVEAGNIVKMFSGNIPYQVNGGLAMVGGSTPDSLIVYTSIYDDSYAGDSNVDGSGSSPAAGNWYYIRFNPTTMDGSSRLERCLFRFGGASEGVVHLQSAAPTIRDCEFEINHWGLWIQNQSDPTVQDNLFRLTTYVPISKSVIANPTFSGNAYDNNGYDALGLIGETIATDLTIHKWDVAGYTNIARILVKTTLTVALGAELTIDPGVVVKMGLTCCGPFASYVTVNGAIDANGTMGEPIIFTSIRDDDAGNPLDTNNDGSLTAPADGNWGYVSFDDVSTDTSNVFDWCVFRYGGYNGYATTLLSASPTFNNCTFQDNNSYGIRMAGASNPVINTCTFGGHTVTPVVMSLISDPTFTGSNNFLATNAYNAIGILGETLAQDVLWKRRKAAKIDNIPYVLTANLTAGLSSILRIEPGVVIKPLSGRWITVQRGLIAEGKAHPDSLIVFTSPHDDFYGGDTNNDSTDTDGSSLRWGYINIANEAIDDSTRFDNCVFRYATNSSTTGALNVTNAHPEIANTIFSNNGIGVNFTGASGDSTKGKIEHCDFMDNTYYGVKNTGMSFTVSAKNSWWGDAGGPNDPSDDTGTGGWYNPNPAGDDVTDRVDYTGYRTGGVGNLLLGDVSLNGEVRAYDASLVLQHLALLITLSAQQQLVGDVNCASGLSTLDASYILQYVAGLIPFFPCAFDSTSDPSSPAMEYLARNGRPFDYLGDEPGDFAVRIPAFTVARGTPASVPIEVSGSGEVLGHEYRVAFDPRQIRIDGVRLTEAARGAALYWSVVEREGEHELVIALARAELLPVTAAVSVDVRGASGLRDGEAVRFEVTRARLNEQDLTAEAVSEGGRAAGSSLPTKWALAQNVPNPFNPVTSIRYDVPVDASGVAVRLVIYDVAGRRVRTLVDSRVGPGQYQAQWDGTDDAGTRVSSGVYFYRIEAGSFGATRKMLLLK